MQPTNTLPPAPVFAAQSSAQPGIMSFRERVTQSVIATPVTRLSHRDLTAKLKPGDYEKKQKYMREVFAECGDDSYIELPFRANWVGRHLHLGSGVYANFNLTLVDDGHIYVGDKVMFGLNVTVATANHPIDPDLRDRGLQYNKDVYIGENTWIGASAVIVPGVHIGKNCVIGAGSVVTKDIPDGVVAVGNPCRVMRQVAKKIGVSLRTVQRYENDEVNIKKIPLSYGLTMLSEILVRINTPEAAKYYGAVKTTGELLEHLIMEKG